MAITTKDILGTDSVSASRITINDNINTIKESVNDVLDAFDTSTGKFDNSIYGTSGNTVKTNGIIVTTSGITVQNGTIKINSGNFDLDSGNLTVTSGDVDISAGKISIQDADLIYSLVQTTPILTVGASAIGIPIGATATLTAPVAGSNPLMITGGKLQFWNGSAWEQVTSA